MPTTVKLDESFASEPDALWQIVGDVCRADWVPAVTSITVDGDIRRMQMAGAGTVAEQIFERDETARRLVYGVVESDAPLTHHRASLEVLAGEDGSRLVWETEVEPEAVVPFIRQAMAASVARLRELLGG